MATRRLESQEAPGGERGPAIAAGERGASCAADRPFAAPGRLALPAAAAAAVVDVLNGIPILGFFLTWTLDVLKRTDFL